MTTDRALTLPGKPKTKYQSNQGHRVWGAAGLRLLDVDQAEVLQSDPPVDDLDPSRLALLCGQLLASFRIKVLGGAMRSIYTSALIILLTSAGLAVSF